MRPLALALALLFAPAVLASAADRAGGLVTGTFPQRLSDRYTTADGPPGRKVTGIALLHGQRAQVAATTDDGPALFQDGKWRAGGIPIVSPDHSVEMTRLPVGAKLLSFASTRDGRAWVVTDRGAFRSRAGGGSEPIPFPKAYLTHQQPVNIDAHFTAVALDPQGHVWFGTDAGIFITDGADWWNVIDRRAGLPCESITCLALGADGEIWAGTTEGVCRCAADGRWEYYWGKRWLPDNHVNGIALDGVDPDDRGGAWVATDGGVAHLYDRPLTLAEKARHYQAITDARHNRYGFVTSCILKKPGDPNGGVLPEASDNDGLWIGIYVGAEAFRYAATHDLKARAEAKRSMFAMLDLARYTGIPGFPARAIIRKGEEADGYDANETVRIDGETDKIWFTSPVDPNVLCKGDTSSDELDGHYFAWYVYHDLVADSSEKRAVAAVVRAVTDNILQHDLTLVGPTGRKTRWGVWSPKYLNDDPTWWEERGLNALEILTYLKVADHVCGDARFAAKYRELIRDHHYLLNTVTQKVAEPWWDVNHSDDEMAFLMYYTLLSLEHEPSIRRVLLQSLERSWQIERPEASSLFNVVYGAVTGRPCEIEAAVGTLQDWPWELICWRVDNSRRSDVEQRTVTPVQGSRIEAQATRVLPASERAVMKWNGNPYELTGGDDGHSEEDGAAWLLPYWMGRYHHLIVESGSADRR